MSCRRTTSRGFRRGTCQMAKHRRRALATGIGPLLALAVSGAAILTPDVALAQGLTGALIGTVSDQQGAAIAGAVVRITSPALIGGALATTTNERGQLRFPSLPPGAYVLEIELPGLRRLSRSRYPSWRRGHHRAVADPQLRPGSRNPSSSTARARASTRETPDSRRASAPRISTPFPRGGSVRTTW